VCMVTKGSVGMDEVMNESVSIRTVENRAVRRSTPVIGTVFTPSSQLLTVIIKISQSRMIENSSCKESTQ
jgi:hypothetical protein